MRKWFPILFALLLVNCKPSRPDGVLSEKKMENILVDYHLALAAAETQQGNVEENRYLLVQAALAKHKVTEAEFDSSLVYWCKHSELFYKICRNAYDRLKYMTEPDAVDRNEKSAYSYLSTEGDTANVWNLREGVIIQPNRVDNIYSFVIEADSTYHPGDSFLWAFRTQFLGTESSYEAFALFSVMYENDSIVGTTQRLSSNHQTEISLKCPLRYRDAAVKSVHGTVYIPTRKEGFGVLALTDFALVRYHRPSKAKHPVTEKADTIRTDTVKALVADSVRTTRNPYEIRDLQGDERTIRIVKDKPVRYPSQQRHR